MKKLRILPLLLLMLLLTALLPLSASAETIAPVYPVPVYVAKLLEVAGAEVGYREGEHGYSKYGEWAGDPYCQWCAEYLCWCVDQTEQHLGITLTNTVWPRYSGTNTGRDWFIRQGRYVCRWGNVDDWGYQWLKGEKDFITTGSYIPQPGDWVFFTWTSNRDTDHVAMVESCTREKDGSILIHVLEGNAPSEVQRTTYPLTYSRILGFGTVHDVMDITMRSGCSGAKVRELQQKLYYLGYLTVEPDGKFGTKTQDAVKAFQRDHGKDVPKVTGIANIQTQYALDKAVEEKEYNDPDKWIVEDD